MGKFQPFPSPKTGLQVRTRFVTSGTCNTSTGGIFMALQENPEGFGGGISSFLLTAKLQSAVANCTFQVSPTLQFHVKNCHPCPGNVTKLCSAVEVFIPLTEQRVACPQKDDEYGNMECYNREFWSCGKIDGFGQCWGFFSPPTTKFHSKSSHSALPEN